MVLITIQLLLNYEKTQWRNVSVSDLERQVVGRSGDGDVAIRRIVSVMLTAPLYGPGVGG